MSAATLPNQITTPSSMLAFHNTIPQPPSAARESVLCPAALLHAIAWSDSLQLWVQVCAGHRGCYCWSRPLGLGHVRLMRLRHAKRWPLLKSPTEARETCSSKGVREATLKDHFEQRLPRTAAA